MLAFRTIVSGTVLLFVALVAGPYIAVQLDFMGPKLNIAWLKFLGLLLALFGLPLATWCAYLLLIPGNNRAVPYASSTGLNIAGPYKYIRNPFMLGWLFILWGEVIFFQSVPLLVYAVILTMCVHFWILAFEEPSLEDRYGNEYREYKNRVSRWIPRLNPKSQISNPK